MRMPTALHEDFRPFMRRKNPDNHAEIADFFFPPRSKICYSFGIVFCKIAPRPRPPTMTGTMNTASLPAPTCTSADPVAGRIDHLDMFGTSPDGTSKQHGNPNK